MPGRELKNCSHCGGYEEHAININGYTEARCLKCRRADSKEYYLRTKHIHNPKRAASTAKRKQTIKEYINGLKNNPCTDCGNIFPPCAMDFDHLEDKKFLISKASYRGIAFSKIQEELSKCELVCAVCHRIRTWKRGQF